MPAHEKNMNAARDAERGMQESQLQIRCYRREKAGWVRAANRARVTLSEWVRKHLNAAASGAP